MISALSEGVVGIERYLVRDEDEYAFLACSRCRMPGASRSRCRFGSTTGAV